MKTNLWDKIFASFWLIYLMFKHWFNMEAVQAELDVIKEDLEKRITEAKKSDYSWIKSIPMEYAITFDLFQTNCFWFEPKELCKSPDGNGVCHKKGLCPILWKLRKV